MTDSDSSTMAMNQTTFCDFCYTDVLMDDLTVVVTVIDGIEQKERACQMCQDEARSHEVRP